MNTQVSNLAAVQAIYEAFGTGNIPGIMERLVDDVAWEDFADSSAANVVPWLKPGRGKEHVMGFFGILGQWQIHDFRVLNLMKGGNQVAATIIIDATTAAGKRFRDEEMHLWTFGEDGKVTSFRHYTDTAKHIAAAG